MTRPVRCEDCRRNYGRMTTCYCESNGWSSFLFSKNTPASIRRETTYQLTCLIRFVGGCKNREKLGVEMEKRLWRKQTLFPSAWTKLTSLPPNVMLEMDKIECICIELIQGEEGHVEVMISNNRDSPVIRRTSRRVPLRRKDIIIFDYTEDEVEDEDEDEVEDEVEDEIEIEDEDEISEVFLLDDDSDDTEGGDSNDVECLLEDGDNNDLFDYYIVPETSESLECSRPSPMHRTGEVCTPDGVDDSIQRMGDDIRRKRLRSLMNTEPVSKRTRASAIDVSPRRPKRRAKGCDCINHSDLNECVWCPENGCTDCSWIGYNDEEHDDSLENFLVEDDEVDEQDESTEECTVEYDSSNDEDSDEEYSCYSDDDDDDDENDNDENETGS